MDTGNLIMFDGRLDELYAARPEDFTALRAKLAGDAKRRGDADEAKRISGVRKPTTAAWVVNRLALGDDDVPRRLKALGERLRDAHAGMDGRRIRDLSAEQHRLVDGLVRRAFEEAEMVKLTGALRDDVMSTIQAVVADPGVADRLGRLTKAPRRGGAPRTPTGASDDALAELQSDLAAARLRHQDDERRLRDAERGLAAAEDAYDKAKEASRDAHQRRFLP